MATPQYKEGQAVEFDLGNGIQGTGKVRGLAFVHSGSDWIVEVDRPSKIDPETYPWSCVVVTSLQLKGVEEPKEPEKPKRPSFEERPDLYECEDCSAKPGSPLMCQACYVARADAGPEWLGTRPRRHGKGAPGRRETTTYETGLDKESDAIVGVLREAIARLENIRNGIIDP